MGVFGELLGLALFGVAAIALTETEAGQDITEKVKKFNTQNAIRACDDNMSKCTPEQRERLKEIKREKQLELKECIANEKARQKK